MADNLSQLLDNFIKLRQTGVNRDEAWYKVVDRTDLSANDAKRLLAMAKEWEKREGHQYHYPARKDLARTNLADSVVETLPMKRRALMVEANAAIERAFEQKRANPVLNPALRDETAEFVPSDEADVSFFTAGSILLFYFPEKTEPMRIKLKPDQEMIVGRVTANAVMMPDIDLSLYGAGDLGVSRMHAVITLQKNRIMLADIGSTNGTFINEDKLRPQELRVLQDKDQVTFGHLSCLVRFYHP